MTTPSSFPANTLPKELKPKTPNPYNPSTDMPSLAGKVILITGANAGIGKQTALDLAKHGDPAQIWIAARTPSSGLDAVKEIQTAAQNVDVRYVELDLTSFESIKRAAREVIQRASRLDILVLNAGIMGSPAGVTSEGYDKVIGTNHVGHALLLKLLTPLLLHTADSIPDSTPRIISLSSTGHRMALPEGGIAFDTLSTSQPEVTGISKYTQSKLANVVYARQYARHFPQLLSVAVHPGEVGTQLFDTGAKGGDARIVYLAREVAPKVCVSVEEGAKNTLWAATAEGVKTGRYYEPVGVLGGGSELSKDEKFGERLWEWTQKELEGQEI